MKKIALSVIYLLVAAELYSQQPASNKEADRFTQMLDASRPGIAHSRLTAIVGKWEFQDTKRTFVKGTVTRTPLYDGRFFMVETTGGRLQLPIADGKMKEGNYKSLMIEGYDNPKGKFVAVAINNHIGSDIQMQWGDYDSVARAFTYYWEDEVIRGERVGNMRVLKLIDDRQYQEEYYEKRGGEFTKIRELVYKKVD